MKFPVLEMFTSIQGEGKFTGEPSVFVRLAGCNLRCVFGNSRCDTPYSSFELEKPICNTVDEAVEGMNNILINNPNIKHVVVTGGEPMLYRNALREFINKIEWPVVLTIETNGTLPAFGHWGGKDLWYDSFVDLWSISPKLSTSEDKNLKYLTKEQSENHNKTRINIDNLISYLDIMENDREYMYSNNLNDDVIPSIQFKFVYTSEESVEEIKSIITQISESGGYDVDYINNMVMLMPEGATKEQLEQKSLECVKVCLREGWRFCDRLHLRIWDSKRCV